MKRVLFFALLSVQFLNAAEQISSQEFFNFYIKDKPQGIVRDFHIWQYFNEYSLNAQEIQTAYDLLNAKNPYLRRTLKKLGKTEMIPKDAQCAEMSAKAALKEDEKCLILVATNKLATFKSLSDQEANGVLAKIADEPTATLIKLIRSPYRTQAILTQNATIFTRLYHALSETEQQSINPSPQLLEQLAQENVTIFYYLLNNIALSSQPSPFKAALLQSHITHAPHKTLFILGINELRFGSHTKALNYFKQAQEATTSRFFVDRALMWQYLITQDKQYLETLAQSKHVNIFSIYATQQLKIKPSYIIQTTLNHLSPKRPPFDITNPYVWQEIVSTRINDADTQALEALIPFFSYTQTTPHLAYLKRKIENFRIHYYFMPYEQFLKWDSREQKSLVYAVAMQESQLIPSLISRSFALGMMQIMPAYIRDFAKEMGMRNIQYYDLFNPVIALKMGRHYLKKLQKEYKHPLFVSYAYNGGPTFLRRLLAKNQLFRKDRAYEPWMSMELIPYEETRFYGMYVVANYIIYEQIAGKYIDIEQFLRQTLIYPR